MVRWFASDHHLWHENIIKFSGRPFANALEMNEALLTYHNDRVKPEDHVYFLGDVTLRRGNAADREEFIKEIKKYKGHKRLFLGNHDHWLMKTYLEAGFEKIYATWRDEQNVLYSHIPVHGGSLGSAVANVHGHIHQWPSPPPVMGVDKEGRVWEKPYVNVCVEMTNYAPIHFDELMARINQAKGEFNGIQTGLIKVNPKEG